MIVNYVRARGWVQAEPVRARFEAVSNPVHDFEEDMRVRTPDHRVQDVVRGEHMLCDELPIHSSDLVLALQEPQELHEDTWQSITGQRGQMNKGIVFDGPMGVS